MQLPASPRNVLMVGAGESYHLEPLARCIKEADSTLRLSVHKIWSYDGSEKKVFPSTSPSFDLVHTSGISNFSPGPATLQSVYKRAISGKKPSVLRVAFKSCAFAARAQLESVRVRKHFRRVAAGVDLIHLQSLFIGPAHYWLLLDHQLPFVASCWGSDVLRNSEPHVMMIQQRLLDQSAAITYTGLEFKEA